MKVNNHILTALILSTNRLGIINKLMVPLDNKYFLTYLTEKVDSIASNRIEGIHSTIEEASNIEVLPPKNNNDYLRYRETLKNAHIKLINNDLVLRYQDLIWIHDQIRGKKIGIRTIPVDVRDSKSKIIHKGIDAQKIQKELTNLINELNTINDNEQLIIKALLIHHQFVYIHPFNDGNGRTGRILLALLFFKYKLLDFPATIISYSIFKNKEKYYKALKHADKKEYNKYLLIMLELLNDSLLIGINFISEVLTKKKQVLDQCENEKMKLIASWTFAGFKVSNKYLVKKTKFNNKTISKYIDKLSTINVIEIEYRGKYKVYKNIVLSNILVKYFARIS